MIAADCEEVQEPAFSRIDLATENAKLRSLNEQLAERCARQSELIGKTAEYKGGSPSFLAALAEMRALHIRKSHDYGRAEDPLKNIRASEDLGIPAWKGAWLRAKDKVFRIDTFCNRGTLANEGVEDSFKDLAAYCIIALTLFREANCGKEEAERSGESAKAPGMPVSDTQGCLCHPDQ